MGKEKQIVYREIQRPRQIWLWVLILCVAGLMWYGFIQQVIFGIPFGENPAPDVLMIIFWVIFGIAFPFLYFGVLRLITEVRQDGLYIRFVPFHSRYKPFLFDDIRHYERITYSPFKRFGGWGIRFNFRGETAYNIGGKQGIEIKLRRQTVVIGSREPDELIKAMDSVQKQ